MNRSLFYLVSLSIVLLIASCSKTQRLEDDFPASSDSNVVSVVPVETALNGLNSFLEEMGVETKGESAKKIASIETHYSESLRNENGEAVPDVYLVNYDNNEGYALLGANSSVTPIIAVIEHGNSSIKEVFSPTKNAPSSFEESSLDPGIPPSRLVSMCVNGALYGEKQEIIETKSLPSAFNITQLTSNYLFNQHVTYCHKNNGGFVTNGCASTALGIIVAYNSYPTMVVDGQFLGYPNLNSYTGTGTRFDFSDETLYFQLSDYFTNYSSIPSNLTSSQKIALLCQIDNNIVNVHGTPTVLGESSFLRTRYKLTSAIFYILNNIIQSWDATGTMPNAVANGLEDLGYTNVDKTQKSSLKPSQIETIYDMLYNGKPVVMCGWSLFSLSDSHYWVVDGLKRNSNGYYIHCNWGWGGNKNGWFASDCIRSTCGQPYDNGSYGDSTGGDEWGNIIVYSYDMQTTTPIVYENELNNRRIQYVPGSI